MRRRIYSPNLWSVALVVVLILAPAVLAQRGGGGRGGGGGQGGGGHVGGGHSSSGGSRSASFQSSPSRGFSPGSSRSGFSGPGASPRTYSIPGSQRFAPASPPQARSMPGGPIIRYAPPAPASSAVPRYVPSSAGRSGSGPAWQRTSPPLAAERDATPDLSTWGRAQRTPVPSLSGSPTITRPAPGISRTSLIASRSLASAGLSRERETSSGEGRLRLHTPAITRESILERYRNAESTAPPKAERGPVRSGASGPDLSQLSGARKGQSADAASTAPSTALGQRGEPRAKRTPLARDEAKGDLARSFDRLRRLAQSDPAKARTLIDQGRIVSTATSQARRVAIGVGVSFTTGWNSCPWFWDPFHDGHHWDHHGHHWDHGWGWWSSPAWCWAWTSAWCPWWGGGWGFGAYSHHFGFWWSGWPSWGYTPTYYTAPPVYYSTVIYDAYQPPAQAPAAAGEGAIQVPQVPEAPAQAGAPPAPGKSRALQSAASQQLTLGDQAFRESRYNDAVHYYAKAVDLSPDEGVLHLILSDALFASGDYHYAAYALRRALELDPTLVDSVVDKHSFYRNPAEFDHQIELLERYVNDHFLDDDARLLLAANYLFANRPSQATELLESPLSLGVRDSAAGKVLLERAKKMKEQKPEKTAYAPVTQQAYKTPAYDSQTSVGGAASQVPIDSEFRVNPPGSELSRKQVPETVPLLSTREAPETLPPADVQREREPEPPRTPETPR